MVLWNVIFWAALTVVLIGAEFATVQLIAVWFGAGSLVAFIVSFTGIDFSLQVIIFIAISIILLLSTRPFVKRFLNSSERARTNADSLIGKDCIVKEEVNPLLGTGRVFISGLDWAAKGEDTNAIYSVNQSCTVMDIQGVTLIIKAK